MADDTSDEAPSEQKLEELEKHIQEARAKGEEAVDSFADEPDERFVDSGAERSDEDDQTIAPPG